MKMQIKNQVLVIPVKNQCNVQKYW